VSNKGIVRFSASRQRNRIRNYVKQPFRIEKTNACRKGPEVFMGSILHCAREKLFCRSPTAISIKAFFLPVYQTCFATFVSVFRHSASDPFLYPSCRPCLPFCLSFSHFPSPSRREGAAALSVLSLGAFMNIPVRPRRANSPTRAGGRRQPE
jgi:hypothetical protein